MAVKDSNGMQYLGMQVFIYVFAAIHTVQLICFFPILMCDFYVFVLGGRGGMVHCQTRNYYSIIQVFMHCLYQGFFCYIEHFFAFGTIRNIKPYR